MLIEFSVTNFKSIKNNIVFSMEKGENTRKTNKTLNNILEVSPDLNLLKSALIFGANASGKSNFLEALIVLNMLVVSSTATVVDKLNYKGYGNSKSPTLFEITFLKNKIEYFYSISYDSTKIYSEILKENNKLVFDRQSDSPDTLRDNQTLIYDYQKNNNKAASNAFKWFAEDLIFEHDYISIPDETLYQKILNPTIKDKFIKILKKADFNIIDAQLVENPPSNFLLNYAKDHIEDLASREQFIKSNKETTLVLIHENKAMGNFNLSIKSESLGTQAAIKFILTMLSYDSNKVLLFDEFDTSFHINLSKTFLSLINSEFQKSQFILTTHEPELMSHNMRKDQIYFMEKNSEGCTSMYSLFDFNQSDTRNDGKSYTKKYLAGRFGGLPVIDEEDIFEILGENTNAN